VQVGNTTAGSSLPAATYLDAAPSLTLTPPTGSSIVLAPLQLGVYLNGIGAVQSGTYKVFGTGGKDIGAFSASFSGTNSAFYWTNQSTTVINRSKGYTVTWSGGDANSYVDIAGAAFGTPNGGPTNVSATFECQTPATAGSFTIPSSVLLGLPATGGSLAVDLNSNVQLIAVTGADAGIVLLNAQSIAGPNVTFQ
jgi:hypothetical protein